MGARKRTQWVKSLRFGPIVRNPLESSQIFILISSCRPQIGGSALRWVRASAPSGCSPRYSGRLFAICSNLLRFLFLSLRVVLRSADLPSSGCTQAHPLGVVPEIQADCLQSTRIFS